jgi:Tfp pilus assembly protein PilV
MVEVIIAIAIIATALTALAYTATAGFTYEDLARQKQTATGIADQIMEQVRGLAWDKITAGHVSSDLSTTDTNLVTGCSGDPAGTYRLFSCTANGTAGSAEKLIASAVACAAGTPDCVYPLIRHTGTITQNNITYTWKTYDTNNCPTSTATGCTASTPYRVTVIVTWTGGHIASNKIVEIQSLFWSPSGCRSTSTHAFAAPCQPFFYGVSKVPQANVHLSGTVDSTTFSEGDLFGSGVESTLQQEQLSQVQGSFSQSGVRIVDGSGEQESGGTIAATSAADTDPGTSATTYSSVSCGSVAYPCSGGTQTSSGGGTTLTFTAPSGETSTSDSTTQATGGNVCPPPSDTAQTDNKPCGGGRIQQGGTLSATYNMSSSPGLGAATLARIAAAASADKSFVDRVQYSSTSICSPANNSDGCVEVNTTRAVGTVNVGGLPLTSVAAATIPSGWNGASAWNGYYFSIVGYQDAITGAVGTNCASTNSSCTTPTIAAPTASVTAGTVYCWNGTNGYNSVAASSATAVSCGTMTIPAQVINGHLVSMSITPVSVSPATITKSPTTATATQTDMTTQIVPPSATIQYRITIDGVDATVLTMTVNLNTLEGRGTYQAAPTAGS